MDSLIISAIAAMTVALLYITCIEIITHKDLSKSKILGNKYVKKILSVLLNLKK